MNIPVLPVILSTENGTPVVDGEHVIVLTSVSVTTKVCSNFLTFRSSDSLVSLGKLVITGGLKDTDEYPLIAC